MRDTIAEFSVGPCMAADEISGRVPFISSLLLLLSNALLVLGGGTPGSKESSSRLQAFKHSVVAPNTIEDIHHNFVHEYNI
jgi:hypothetical protein